MDTCYIGRDKKRSMLYGGKWKKVCSSCVPRFTDYCPSPAPVSWTIIVGRAQIPFICNSRYMKYQSHLKTGLALYLISFAAGIAPIPWTGDNVFLVKPNVLHNSFWNCFKLYDRIWTSATLRTLTRHVVTFRVAVNSEIYPMWARTLCTRCHSYGLKSFTFSSKSGSNVFVALSEMRKTASHWETKHIFGIQENIKIAVLAMFFRRVL